jgi:hypothetical protein
MRKKSAAEETDLNIDNGSNNLSDLPNTGGNGRAAEGTGSACSIIGEEMNKIDCEEKLRPGIVVASAFHEWDTGA